MGDQEAEESVSKALEDLNSNAREDIEQLFNLLSSLDITINEKNKKLYLDIIKKVHQEESYFWKIFRAFSILKDANVHPTTPNLYQNPDLYQMVVDEENTAEEERATIKMAMKIIILIESLNISYNPTIKESFQKVLGLPYENLIDGIESCKKRIPNWNEYQLEDKLLCILFCIESSSRRSYQLLASLGIYYHPTSKESFQKALGLPYENLNAHVENFSRAIPNWYRYQPEDKLLCIVFCIEPSSRHSYELLASIGIYYHPTIKELYQKALGLPYENLIAHVGNFMRTIPNWNGYQPEDKLLCIMFCIEPSSRHSYELLASLGIYYHPTIKELYQKALGLPYENLIERIENFKRTIPSWSEYKQGSKLLYILFCIEPSASNSYQTRNLLADYLKLWELGFPYNPDNQYLYQIIQDHEKIGKGGHITKEKVDQWIKLHEDGFHRDLDTKSLHEVIMSCKRDQKEKIIQAFITIHQGRASCRSLYVKNFTLYDRDMVSLCGYYDRSYRESALAEGLIMLEKAGFFYADPDTQALYEAIIKHSKSAYQYVPALIQLSRAGLVYNQPEMQFLYQTIMENPRYANNLAEAFIDLHNKGFVCSNPDMQPLYQFVIKNPKYAKDLAQALIIFQALGIHYSDENSLYFSLEAELYKQITPIFSQLMAAGYNFQIHAYVFEFFIRKVNGFGFLSYLDIRLLKNLEHYDSIHDMRRADFERIITEHSALPLAEGPLNKAQAVRDVEALLENIASTPLLEEIQIDFNEFSGYEIEIPGFPRVQLSILLRNANLSHLTLPNELINRLGDIMAILNSEEPHLSDELTATHLPEASRVALRYYCGFRYKNINHLFRGKAFEPDDEDKRLNEIAKKRKMLALFLYGALANDAINKLPWLIWNAEIFLIFKKMGIVDIEEIRTLCQDEAYYSAQLNAAKVQSIITEIEYDTLMAEFANLQKWFPTYQALIRMEDENEELAKRRQANGCQYTQGLTSFSIFSGDALYCHSYPVKTTLMQKVHCPVVHAKDGEVIISAGETMLYTASQSTTLFATLVRSPLYQQQNHAFSERALIDAYQNYLSKPYSEKESPLSLRDKTISRPNHSLAHTYRVMAYIIPLINYFARYAQDEAFKAYCQLISAEEIECLRVAAAFSVTGRENEASAMSNLKEYDRFRENSALHFARFIENNASKEFNDPEVRDRVYHIIRYMGNPAYETYHSEMGIGPLNDIPNDKERMHRNYMHRILTAAHKLDLPRCQGIDDFKKGVMMYCINLSENSEEQSCELNELVRYGIQLIKAHGDNLWIDIDFQGELSACNQGYESPFDEVSTSLERLRSVTESVPKPCQSDFLSHITRSKGSQCHP